MKFAKAYEDDREQPQRSQPSARPARGSASKSIYGAALGKQEAPSEDDRKGRRSRGRGRGRADEGRSDEGRRRDRADEDRAEGGRRRGRADEARSDEGRRGRSDEGRSDEGRRRGRSDEGRRSRADESRADESRADESGEDGALPKQRKRRRRRKEGEANRAAEKSARLARAHAEEIPADGDFGGAFRQFQLSAPVLLAIHQMGWSDPSEIQERLIPRALEGQDVVGQARTGTGKTGAFAIPLIERFQERASSEQARGRTPSALILTPTRELALQIDDQLQQLGVHTDVRTVPVYGGAPMEPQLRALRNGCDIIVGTPGRVMDHVRRGTLSLDEVTCFVLDEADRMFDLGFRDDIYWVARRLPSAGYQTLLLSATMSDEVLDLAKEVTQSPEVIRTTFDDELTVSTVEQFYVAVDNPRKLGLLVHLVADEKPEKGMVFTRTKRGADRVAQRLRERGIDAGEIHGDLRQKQREQILKRFRNGHLHVLVATDVAARGLDIQGVSHIFNFDTPENAEDYVHRVGRTARMGKSGRAFTFVTPQDGSFLTEIEKLINKVVPRFEVDGYRTEATEEERAKDPRSGPPRRKASDHPMAGKFSPALLSILDNQRRGRGPGGGGGGRGGGGGGRRGGPAGRGKGSHRGGGRGR